MRSLGTRRAALVAGAATVAVLALGGCSAGQVAETAILDTPIAGVDTETEDGSVYVRNVQIEYNGLDGYQAGENAPLEMSLYNQTNEPVTIAISSRPLERSQVVSARQVGFIGGGAATPSGPAASGSPAPGAVPEPSSAVVPGASAQPGASQAPAAPTVTPARVELGPQGSALFRPSDAEALQVIGLTDDLKPGMGVNLILEFSNGSPSIELQAPIATPLSPAPRHTSEPFGGEEDGH